MQSHLSGFSNVAPESHDKRIDQTTDRKDAEVIDVNINEDSHFSFSTGTERLLSKLCLHCQNIFGSWEEIALAGSGRLPHYNNEHALETSTNAGCGLCAQFMLDGCRPEPYYPCFYTDKIIYDDDDRLLKGCVWLTRDKFTIIDSWGLELILPILRGDDKEYDEWDEEQPLCVKRRVNLIPAHYQATLAAQLVD